MALTFKIQRGAASTCDPRKPQSPDNTTDNQGSTLAENIRYLMYKYNILIDDWHRPLSY